MTRKLTTTIAFLAALSAGRAQGQLSNNGPLPAQTAPSSPTVPASPAPAKTQAAPATPDTRLSETASSLPRPENLTTFEPTAVELKYNEGRWVLMAGSTMLKDFGLNEQEARQAWYLIRELHLNQRATIGAPKPVLEYWLRDGHAPESLPRSVRSMPLNPSALRVEQSQGFWVVREPVRVLFNFGASQTEANQALGVLRRYGFNQVGVIGHASPSMLIFASRPEADTPRSNPARVAISSPVHGPGGLAGKDPDKVASEVASFYPAPALPGLRSGGQPFHVSTHLPRARGPFAAFQNQAGAAGMEKGVEFDWRQVQVRHDSKSWKLTANGQVLADLGSSERDARLAQAAVMHYRLTEQHLIGTPPVAGYFLSGGQVPQGVMAGLLNDTFHPETVTVRQFGPNYCLAERSHPILDCGPNQDDAQQLLQVVRQYRFDTLCRIGPDEQHALTLFVRGH